MNTKNHNNTWAIWYRIPVHLRLLSYLAGYTGTSTLWHGTGNHVTARRALSTALGQTVAVYLILIYDFKACVGIFPEESTLLSASSVVIPRVFTMYQEH